MTVCTSVFPLSATTYPKPGDLGIKPRLSEDGCKREVGEEQARALENRGWALICWLPLHWDPGLLQGLMNPLFE